MIAKSMATNKAPHFQGGTVILSHAEESKINAYNQDSFRENDPDLRHRFKIYRVV